MVLLSAEIPGGMHEETETSTHILSDMTDLHFDYRIYNLR